jgi:hypothetical protein
MDYTFLFCINITEIFPLTSDQNTISLLPSPLTVPDHTDYSRDSHSGATEGLQS